MSIIRYIPNFIPLNKEDKQKVKESRKCLLEKFRNTNEEGEKATYLGKEQGLGRYTCS